jgi:hypothetical protein
MQISFDDLQRHNFLAASEVGGIVAADALFQTPGDAGMGLCSGHQMGISQAGGQTRIKGIVP